MRVAVTGATGNVGTAVVSALSQHPDVDEVIAIARRQPDTSPPKTEHVAADIAADSLAAQFAGADAVIHLAWRFQPTHRPITTWQTNVIGTVRVLDAVAAAGVPSFVYSSSVGAYSPPPADDRPVDESWPTHTTPTAIYGREKAYVERILDEFEVVHPHIRVARLRPAFMFQRRSASEQRRIFGGRFLPRHLFDHGFLPIVPLPRGLRFQALHTADAAEAFVTCALGRHRGAFNLAADGVIDATVLAETLGTRKIDVPLPLVRGAVAAAWRVHAAPVEPGLIDLVMRLPLLDTTRAISELGWRPLRSAHEALAELFGGISDGAGAPTPPLHADVEIATPSDIGGAAVHGADRPDSTKSTQSEDATLPVSRRTTPESEFTATLAAGGHGIDPQTTQVEGPNSL